jgi:hypothetical protein
VDETSRETISRAFGAANPKWRQETCDAYGSNFVRLPKKSKEEVLQAMQLEVVSDDDDELPQATRLLDAEDAEPPRFHVGGLLLGADLNFWASDGGAGKSGAALHVAGSVINGLPVFGHSAFAVNRIGPVLYVSEEDGLGVIKNRMEALARGESWDPGHTLANFYTLAREGASLDSEPWKAHLMKEVAELEAVLVVFDPYSELTTANENSNTENKPLVRFFRQISNDTGATVLVNHHLSQPYEGKRKIDRVRGATAIRDAARSVFILERTELGTSFECLKMSRAEPTPKFVVERKVITHPDNPAEWVSARMVYLEESVADDMEAEKFVIDQLTKRGQLNSSDLKKLAQGTGVCAPDVSKAISTLHTLGRIDFEKGKHGAKNWFLTRLPENSRQPRQPTLPACQNVAGQGSDAAPEGCQAHYRAGNQATQPETSRQGYLLDSETDENERSEREAMQEENGYDIASR